MAETLITGHELILKVYDEEGGELLYSEGFSQEPNMDVDEYLAERNISLSGNASIEICCELTGDCQDGYSPDASFQQILSEYPGGGEIERCYLCTEVDEEAGKCTYGETLCRTALEIPATVEMRVYGAFKKENNQHGAIFTWHSVRDEDYSAMRGPCPEGFHVPTSTEMQALINAGISLSAWTASNGDGMKTYLKLPYSGWRSYSNGNQANSGYDGHYYCCNRTTSPNALYVSSSQARLNSGGYRSEGESIRPFKDTPIIPDSSWTMLYQSPEATGGDTSGIYHNTTLGLISISSDGITWITISDKNVGATVVYNSGDTLNASNCGGYFQWGNCYMFPYTGAINTSSTNPSAEGYGPGNYYSSDTFILGYSWDTSDNKNLRGGVTGVVSGYKLLHRERYLDYSAMRGPCPEGYHLATAEECGLFVDFLNTFEKTPSELAAYLKIPKCGNLSRNSGNRTNSGSQSINHCAGTILMWTFSAANFIYNPDSQQGSEGGFVRPIADVPVIPDASRTTIFDGSQSHPDAGIFWNQSLELISISDNGTRRLTMADKNLGATVVYDGGSTYNQNNSGNAFQRGNCHPFPFSGAGGNTSPDRVDTTGYGPSNYYSSDTFITDNTRRQITYNPNLRGGVTGAVERDRRVI